MLPIPRSIRRCSLWSAAAVLALALLSHAQEYRGKVQGAVTDTSGAVVPGAQVVLLNTQTGVGTTRETDASGHYLFDLVEPGTYSLTCEHAGFSKFIQEAFTVEVHGDITVNMPLRIGQVSDSVTVTAPPTAVQFNSSNMELVVDRKALEEMPTIGRNPFVLAQLDPMVQQAGSFTGAQADRTFPFYMFVSNLVNVGGNTTGKNELLLDGAPIMVANRGSYSPPMDAVQEFTVQENSVDAQYGRSAGGVMNVAVKSGTNDYHGTAYYFGRNPLINARSNAVANTVNKTRNNIAGGTVGGPVKKDKLFNFAAFEDWRATEFEQQINRSVPNAFQRTGDFSQSKNANGGLLTIYDPWTTVLVNSTTATRTPFPGNVIPASRIDATAKRVMQDVPLPNNPGIDIMGDQNLKAGYYNQHAFWNFTDRGDWDPNDKWRVNGRFSRFQEVFNPNYYSDNPGLGLYGGIMDAQNIAGNAVYTFNPHMVLDVRASMTAVADDMRDTNDAITASTMASFWPNNPWYQSYLKGSPTLYYPQFGDLAGLASGQAYWVQGTTTNASATLAQQLGKHDLKFGGEFSRFAEYNFNPTGLTFAFAAADTANTYISPNTALSGSEYSSFLLGAISSGSDSYVAPQDMRVYYGGLFIQDDYRITRKLTLNLGLRWEYETPPREINNEYTRYLDLSNPIPEMQANPPQIPAAVTSLAKINYQWNGALVFANSGHPGLWNNSTHNFMPRIGAAYAINEKTAIRFGFARFIDPPMDEMVAAANMLLGPAYGYSVTSSVIGTQTGIPQTLLSNPFPSSNALLPVPGQSLGRYTQLGGSVTWNDQNFLAAVNDRYTLSFQRQLPGKLLVDASYYMILSHNMPVSLNMNQANPALGYEYQAAVTKTVPNPFYNYLTPNTFPGPLRNQATIAISALLTPYPQYQTLTEANVPEGLSHTYAVDVRARRSFSHGLGFTAGYYSPWTRTTGFFDNSTNLDQYLNRQTFIGTATARHHVTISGTYELPVGKGRPLLGGAPRVVNAMVGGWSYSSIFTFISGSPIQFGALQVVKPSSPKLADPTRQEWFDTSFFQKQPAYTPRTNPYFYDGLTGPRNWNINSTLSKQFPFQIADHSCHAEFRMEAYNLLNKIMWSDPNVTVTSALFGRVVNQSNIGRELQYTLRIIF